MIRRQRHCNDRAGWSITLLSYSKLTLPVRPDGVIFESSWEQTFHPEVAQLH